MKFLSLVDPIQLKGYTVEFFSGNRNSKITEEMKKIAHERGISVIIHTEAVNRTELVSALCSAKGAIHYAKTDANPRAFYESLMANLPVLITKESRIPRIALEQPFVEDLKFGDIDELGQKMKHFMNMIKDPIDSKRAREDISKFVAEELDEDLALARVCTMMGICQPNARQQHLVHH